MFRKLMTLEEALHAVIDCMRPRPLGTEEVPLLEVENRVLARDVVADRDIPPFDRSTVDGFAAKAEDTFGANEKGPVTLRIAGNVSIGEAPKVVVRKGTTVEIVTGAPIPKGADSVVMIEQTEREEATVRLFVSVTKNTNVQRRGTDIRRGETILKQGTLLNSRFIGVLAALGMAKVPVHRTPRVAILSTGPELVEPAKSLSQGKIYDSNAYSLSAATIESGGRPSFLGIFPDEPGELRVVLSRALASTDVIVTSGGVSVGPKDVMPKVVDSLGKPGLVVSGIAIKPGKPTTVGIVGKTPVFCLPGHPTSALLVFQLVVSPILMTMAGIRRQRETRVQAFAARRMFSAKGRRTFIMVRVQREKPNKIVAEPVAGGESGAITTLAKADGFVEIPENVQFVEAGEKVQVHLFVGQN